MPTRTQAMYEGRIVRDSAILGGKPVVKGTRIPVGVVLEYLANNPNFEELFADYPRLTVDDVRACLAFARACLDERTADRGGGPLPAAL
jgi:uncharacterized protein (DUF433 family)